MSSTTIDRLIINSPYEELRQHRRYNRKTRRFERVEGRRPAGYEVATPCAQSIDEQGIESLKVIRVET
ncbi:hypothetical protein [Synechococcus sp. H55.11]|uniref:hypothetical protein n=1 Tax=unclassified Synechococcus TaxID=2626047 RepID=UPI0039C3BF64